MMRIVLGVAVGVVALVGTASAQYPDPSLKVGDIERIRLQNELGETVGALVSLRADLARAEASQQEDRVRAVEEQLKTLQTEAQQARERLRQHQEIARERAREMQLAAQAERERRELLQRLSPGAGAAGPSQCGMPDGTSRTVDTVMTFQGTTYRCVTVFDGNLVPAGVAWTRVQEQQTPAR